VVDFFATWLVGFPRRNSLEEREQITVSGYLLYGKIDCQTASDGDPGDLGGPFLLHLPIPLAPKAGQKCARRRSAKKGEWKSRLPVECSTEEEEEEDASRAAASRTVVGAILRPTEWFYYSPLPPPRSALPPPYAVGVSAGRGVRFFGTSSNGTARRNGTGRFHPRQRDAFIFLSLSVVQAGVVAGESSAAPRPRSGLAFERAAFRRVAAAGR